MSLIDSDADEVVQTDLTNQPSLHLVEPLNLAGIINTEGESDEPLFRLTITRFTKLNSTSIGICASHILCTFSAFPAAVVVLTGTIPVDGSGFMLFLGLLSQLYQGLEPVDPLPYYEQEAIKFTEPSGSSSPATSVRGQFEGEAMEFVGFRLTAAQVAGIHNAVTNGVTHLKISRVDTVVGLLSLCLSEVEPESEPIDTISHVVDVGGLIFLSSESAYFAIVPQNGPTLG